MTGRVQGVGFRPFVARGARGLGLAGCVANERGGVRVEVEGAPQAVAALVAQLWAAPPPARVAEVLREDGPGLGSHGFHIMESALEGALGSLPPPDLATCERCRQEMSTDGDRRVGYGLISCIRCGPRYSATAAIPFDRERTSLTGFPLCEACSAEYADPGDRRHHAQTLGCAACGPRVRLRGVEGEEFVGIRAIEVAVARLRAGEVVALKGLGGMQLLCDAGDEAAVARLRRLKRRPEQPFAVMVGPEHPSLQAADRALLEGSDAPIVLLGGVEGMAPNVADGLPWCGLMAPTTGVHLLLLERVGRSLVCTSGNRSGEPLARTPEELWDQLGGVLLPTLDHDRPILRRVDDSVVRRVGDGAGGRRTLVLRRARGRVPDPIGLLDEGPTVLALGADLKSAPGVAQGRRAVLAPYVGRLGGRAMAQRLDEELAGLLALTGAEPEAIVCDQHPDYVSTRVAEELARERGLALLRVQHHEAHIAAVIAEHGLRGPVLGFAFDGTGAGRDGTTWGAEVLRWRGGGFARTPFFTGFALPGGDRCARSPARSAMGLLHALGVLEVHADALAEDLGSETFEVLRQGLERGLFPHATSMGRLFDAVAWLCGGPPHTTYEAQAAMWLEGLAGGVEASVPDGPLPLSTRVLTDVYTCRRGRLSSRGMARRLHAHVAVGVVRCARGAGIEDVVLTGGCFQNAVLLEECVSRLEGEGFRVHLPQQLPPNDGGIALGQLWLARRALATGDGAGHTA